MITDSQRTLLTNPQRHPFRTSGDVVKSLGSVMVIAPHPDDESLGCGGLLALLGQAGSRISVLVMTDGSRSHPHSHSHPPCRLAAVREKETLATVDALGLRSSAVQFLRYPDCGLVSEDSPEFTGETSRIRQLLEEFEPDTLVVPWRRDPHCDHVATWQLLRAAATELHPTPRWLEYPVWAWTKAQTEVAPQEGEGRAWRLDISKVLEKKTAAIHQHQSQLGRIIRDDPGGFVLEPAMLENFELPWELYIEPYHV